MATTSKTFSDTSSLASMSGSVNYETPTTFTASFTTKVGHGASPEFEGTLRQSVPTFNVVGPKARVTYGNDSQLKGHHDFTGFVGQKTLRFNFKKSGVYIEGVLEKEINQKVDVTGFGDWEWK
jgi:hypothetical protein